MFTRPEREPPRRIDVSCTARSELLAWARGHAPDLRVGHERDPATGARASRARFTYAGRLYELCAPDPDALARAVHAALLSAMGLAPGGEDARAAERARLAARLVRARLNGRVEEARAVALQLVGLGEPAAARVARSGWST